MVEVVVVVLVAAVVVACCGCLPLPVAVVVVVVVGEGWKFGSGDASWQSEVGGGGSTDTILPSESVVRVEGVVVVVDVAVVDVGHGLPVDEHRVDCTSTGGSSTSDCGKCV